MRRAKRTVKKKTTRKKHRTPAQIRATKKLVALNKSRKRKVTKKRVVARKRNPAVKKRAVKKSCEGYTIVVKNIRTGKIGYFTGTGFDSEKKQAIMSRSKQVMVNIAKNIPSSSVGPDWNMFISSEK